MFTAKIKDIKKDVLQATQEPFLDVEVEILNEKGKVAETRKYAYPLGTPAKDIKRDVENMLESYHSDLESKEASKEKDSLHAKADKTIEALKGVEVGSDE